MKKIRKRLTYANVMATIAVFLLLGGGAAFAALGKNTVGTKQLKNNAVTTAKIKKGAVTGAKIKLSSLGKVPSAANADNATNAINASNANTVGGNAVVAINFSGNPTTGPAQILNLDGFTLTATCSAGDALSVVANGPSGSRLQSAGQDSFQPSENKDSLFTDSLTPTSNVNLLFEDDDLITGNTQFSLGNGGRAVSVTWEAESFGAASGPHCTFTGYAFG